MKKVLLKSMLLFVAVLFAGISTAQTVSGTVTEENGPLPGANVIVKGTQNGVTTDFDGNYTLNNVASDAILVFSYVGYSTQEIAVGGRSTINVALAADNALDEVVVIGYGSQRIKDATGSVAVVNAEDFNGGVISSPEQLIQGKTAGVQITQTTGEPGAGINIRIRGSNSLRGNNDPLFVVDGVPITGNGAPPSGNIGIGTQNGESRNPLSFINPNDIASINILKDASATAIYGSRAANGVVIIQTKSGKGNTGGTWEINTSVSHSTAADTYDLLDRNGFLEGLVQFGGEINAATDGGGNTDWQDFIFRDTYSRQTDFSYSRSYTNGNVRAGVAYSNQLGIVESSGQERISGRLNAQHKFLDNKLTLDFQGTISRVNDDAPPLSATAGFNGDLIGASLVANPTYSTDPNDNLFAGGSLSPANLLANYQSRSNNDRVLANLSANYQITDEFSAKVLVGYDETDAINTTIFTSLTQGLGNATEGNGRATLSEFLGVNKLLEGTLNYKKEFGKSKIDILGGYSYQEFRRSGFNASAFGLSGVNFDNIRGDLINSHNSASAFVPDEASTFGFGNNTTFTQTLGLDDEGNPTVITDPLASGFNRSVRALVSDNFNNTDELQSFFVRGNYTYNDKYLFTATLRADGSTAFGDENQYGYFPSGAFAWRLDQEDFVGENISTLKLRLGAGSVGNQQGLGFANFLLQFGVGGPNIDNNGDVFTGDLVQFGNDNPDLKWESTTDFNIGLDFGFNNDRFSGTFDVYRKETNDLLFNRIVADPAGGGTRFFENLDDGTVVNQGVELSLNYDFFDTDDFGFSASFNISWNDNEVQDTNQVADTGQIRGQGLTNAFVQRLEAGQPLFSFFLPIFEGFDAAGQPIYQDIDGDGTGDPSLDKTFVGKDAQADFNAGLSLNLRYKRFDLSAFFNSQFDFYVYNATANAFFNASNITSARNTTQDVLTSGEAAGASADVSTRFLEKGDFVRLQSLTLGYDFPLKGDGLFDSLRLYANAQNLFLITDYSGLDPEVTTNTGDLGTGVPSLGIDYAAFPRPRTVTLGVNAKF